MKIKNILHWMFEITNKKDQKVITILGVKFHYKRPEKMYIFEHIFCYFVRKFCKVKKNKILVCNKNNMQYACNPKYITEELVKRISDLDIVWICSKNTDKTLFPKQVRFVNYFSLKLLYELLTAKVWIINNHLFLQYKKGLVKQDATIHL